jgi:hypothetical protein
VAENSRITERFFGNHHRIKKARNVRRFRAFHLTNSEAVITILKRLKKQAFRKLFRKDYISLIAH